MSRPLARGVTRPAVARGIGGGRLIACLVAMVLALGLAACGPRPSTGSPSGDAGPQDTHLTVFAAASLRNALTSAVSAYSAAHPGMTFTISTGSSASLATQIQQGAPVDVFLSADTTNPQHLVDLGLAVGPVKPFARNRLVIVVPNGNPAGITTPLDLGRPGVKVIAAADPVPITRYADQLVRNLANESDATRGFANRYAANVVSREDDVAAVLAKIQLGEGDAAIVYATDARASGLVETIEVPSAANVVATYGGVVVGSSTRAAAAAAFLAWLAGPDGAAALAPAGFLPPS